MAEPARKFEFAAFSMGLFRNAQAWHIPTNLHFPQNKTHDTSQNMPDPLVACEHDGLHHHPLAMGFNSCIKRHGKRYPGDVDFI